MHFGNKNLRSKYSIDDPITKQRNKLDVLEYERDLAVFISSDLKWSKHVANIALKMNKVLGMLHHGKISFVGMLIFGSSCTKVLLGLI